MVRHFLQNPTVAAVTGNPRIRTRSTLLGRIQVGEFSSIVGMIKRAQRTFTVYLPYLVLLRLFVRALFTK